MRLIIVSDESGENESVMFTEDFTEIASDHCEPGQDVTLDVIVDVEFPPEFPLDYMLKRQ